MKKVLLILLLISGSAAAQMSIPPPVSTGGQVIPNFPTYSYTPIGRDPFISPESPSTIVSTNTAITPQQDTETLASLLEKLRTDLLANYKVIGVCIDPDPRKCCALVDTAAQFKAAAAIASPTPQQTNTSAIAGALAPVGAATSAANAPQDPGAMLAKIDAALDPSQAPGAQPAAKKQRGVNMDQLNVAPPKNVTIASGFPMKANTEKSSYITRLSAKIGIVSGVKLRRDVKKDIVYMPIKMITADGIYIGFPGSEISILIPYLEDTDTSPLYDRAKTDTKSGGLL